MAEAGQWRVLASRPAGQNRAWCEQLRNAGYQVLDLPLLAIVPASEQKQQQAIKQKILDFDQYQAVIFVSQNAVQACWQWLDKYWPQLPAAMHYIAVGSKTAECVNELLLQNTDASFSVADSAMNTEALLALPELQQVAKKKILICRGLGGRPKLGEALSERGAHVDYCELYSRRLPGNAEALMGAENFVSQRDIISVFSGETLQNLQQLAEKTGKDLSAIPLLVPGERVARFAQTLAYKNIIVATNASSDVMLEALNHFVHAQG